jgi:hypothetical protein
MDDNTMRWNPDATAPISEDDPHCGFIPHSSATIILGVANSDGLFQEFAIPGESGSSLLRMVRDPRAVVPDAGIVVRIELLGIVYGIMFEKPSGSFVAVYLLASDIFDHWKAYIGIGISMDVSDRVEARWEYSELGK